MEQNNIPEEMDGVVALIDYIVNVHNALVLYAEEDVDELSYRIMKEDYHQVLDSLRDVANQLTKAVGEDVMKIEELLPNPEEQ